MTSTVFARPEPRPRQISAKEAMESVLPRGIWVDRFGTQTLFNHKYEPIWTRAEGQSARRANQTVRVDKMNSDTDVFYGKDNAPWNDNRTRQRCEAILKAWGCAP